MVDWELAGVLQRERVKSSDSEAGWCLMVAEEKKIRKKRVSRVSQAEKLGVQGGED